MDPNVPYLMTVKRLPQMMAKIQTAALPPSFTLDFLKGLGFTSSADRGIIKVLKYIGFVDANAKPLEPYRKYLDHTVSKKVLAQQLRASFDDLFFANKSADKTTAGELKGWFKTKTGLSEAVAEKIATTFKALADLGDFAPVDEQRPKETPNTEVREDTKPDAKIGALDSIGLVYRFEIHPPDTQNIDTYRAIFRALREELGK